VKTVLIFALELYYANYLYKVAGEGNYTKNS